MGVVIDLIQDGVGSKVLTVIRTMDAIERASRWKPLTASSCELQKIVENLQDIVENSEDIITVPHPTR
jgi:hypothetical protein